MSRIEEQIRAAREESEATGDEPYPEGTVPTRPGQARSVVQSVRLPVDAFAEIERIARAADAPVARREEPSASDFPAVRLVPRSRHVVMRPGAATTTSTRPPGDVRGRNTVRRLK